MDDIQYPLHTGWDLLIYKSTTKYDWDENNLKKVATVCSVDEYWDLFSQLEQHHPDIFNTHSTYFMRTGIPPKWEDASHIQGGAWSFVVPKKMALPFWKEFSMSLVGEYMVHTSKECSCTILGMSMSPKKHNVSIKIWNSLATCCATNGLNKQVQEIYKFLKVDTQKTKWIYKAHNKR